MEPAGNLQKGAVPVISVYDIGNTAYDKLGDAVLEPVSGKVRQIAGGGYELTMECPLDAEGKWRHLVPEAVVRAPVPEETIETAFTGMDADVYVTNDTAALRSGPEEPEPITHDAWNANTVYEPGDQVSVTGWSHSNYQCVTFDESSAERYVPPYNSRWWVEIADTTEGDPELMTMPSGTEVYYIEASGEDWSKVCTMYGLIGYVKNSQITYSRHVTPAETQPREITEQLFRIRKVTTDTRNLRVTVNAEHVSYDLSGVLIKDVTVNRASAAFALAWIRQAFMISYRGIIATNMTSTSSTSYTAQISGKNGTYAILDPDKGVAKVFDAACRRDNWDWFVMSRPSSDPVMQIRRGNNLIGVNWSMDSQNLVNRVVPVAKDEGGGDLYLDGLWVDSSRISQQPVVRMERIRVNGQVGKDDGTGTGTVWTESDLKAEMTKQAQARFSVDKSDLVVNEITVDFVRLGDTEEYDQYRNLQKVVLYDRILAKDEAVGLTATVEVSEIEYDIKTRRITALKLTNVALINTKNVTGFNVVNNSITGDKLTDDVSEQLIGSATGTAMEYTDDEIEKVMAWATNKFVAQ